MCIPLYAIVQGVLLGVSLMRNASGNLGEWVCTARHAQQLRRSGPDPSTYQPLRHPGTGYPQGMSEPMCPEADMEAGELCDVRSLDATESTASLSSLGEEDSLSDSSS